MTTHERSITMSHDRWMTNHYFYSIQHNLKNIIELDNLNSSSFWISFFSWLDLTNAFFVKFTKIDQHFSILLNKENHIYFRLLGSWGFCDQPLTSLTSRFGDQSWSSPYLNWSRETGHWSWETGHWSWDWNGIHYKKNYIILHLMIHI